MTFKLVETSVMDDIANAVRERNGEHRLYKPGELAGAVLALDGTGAGGAVHTYAGLDKGLVNDTAFKGIANALRLHGLTKRKFKPRDMAAAIRALDFDTTEKVRAILHADGTLELNVYAGLRTDLDADVLEVYAFDGTPTWLEAADAIRAVEFRPSMTMAFQSDMSGWFAGCSKLVEVRGFDYVAGALSNVDGMFAGCEQLDSVFSVGQVTQRQRSGVPFEGCLKLVGTDVALVDSNSSGDVMYTGAGGAIVRKSADKRRFVNANLYSGGTLTFTTSKPTTQYNCISTGRICAGIAYASVRALPYHDERERVKSVQFKRGICSGGDMHLDYWFAGCDNIRGFTGWENFYSSAYYGDTGTTVTYRARSMRHTFDGCGMSVIDLAGLDPAGLVDVSGCFSGCSELRRVYADATWQLPGECMGSDVFAGCERLVGGNVTTWSAGVVGASMMAIDRDGEPGYMTAR